MKSFEYSWQGDVFLLHLQLSRPAPDGGRVARLERSFQGGDVAEEAVQFPEGLATHRFIVSRSHPREAGVRLRYPADLTLEAFEIDDRAYYPTQSFFVG